MLIWNIIYNLEWKLLLACLNTNYPLAPFTELESCFIFWANFLPPALFYRVGFLHKVMCFNIFICFTTAQNTQQELHSKVPVPVVKDTSTTCVFTHWRWHWPQGTEVGGGHCREAPRPRSALLDSALWPWALLHASISIVLSPASF